MLDVELEPLQLCLPGPDGKPYYFGREVDPVAVILGGWDMGKTSWRTQDAQAPGSDLVMMGRDYVAPKQWTFQFVVNADGRARDVLEELARVWRADTARLTPGAVVPLRYGRPGDVQRVVFGRPREFTEQSLDVWSDDYALVTAVFDLADPTVYDADQSAVVLRMGGRPLAGWVWGQFVWPIRPQIRSWRRDGQVDAGSAPVRFTAVFTADASTPTPGVSLRLVGGWRITLADPLPPSTTVTVDTQSRTAVDQDANPVRVSLDSKLSATLPAGESELFLTAQAVTGVQCTVSWQRGNLMV